MSAVSTILCQGTIYKASIYPQHGSTIDVYVEDTADTTNCHIGWEGWRVP